MKINHRSLEKDGSGSIKMTPEEDDDMWHLYNLICNGDELTGSSYRKVQKESSTGSVQSSKLKVKLTVTVELIEFDAAGGKLRVGGRVCRENDLVRMGAYHTVELELHRSLELHKTCWDALHLHRVEQASDPRNYADVAAVVLEQGLAHVCLVTPHMTVLRAKIEVSIPGKRLGSTSARDKAERRFYDGVMEAMVRHINFSVVKCVIVASPGFWRDELMRHVWAEAGKRGLTDLLEARSKFLLVHAPSGQKHALKHVLSDAAVAARVTDTKAFNEVAALDQFSEMLREDASRAFYGYRHVRFAIEQRAVDSLLISDALFRNVDVNERRKFVQLVEDARDAGARVHIFSQQHVSGEQLDQFGGVAAVLRFGLDEDEVEAAAVAHATATGETAQHSHYDSDSEERTEDEDEEAARVERFASRTRSAAAGAQADTAALGVSTNRDERDALAGDDEDDQRVSRHDVDDNYDGGDLYDEEDLKVQE